MLSIIRTNNYKLLNACELVNDTVYNVYISRHQLCYGHGTHFKNKWVFAYLLSILIGKCI